MKMVLFQFLCSWIWIWIVQNVVFVVAEVVFGKWYDCDITSDRTLEDVNKSNMIAYHQWKNTEG